METSTSIKQWPKDERPRERLITNGSSSLSNSELLAILLQTGSKNHSALDLSKQVLDMVDQDLSMLSKLEIIDLQRIKGIGLAKAVILVAAMELLKRAEHSMKKVEIIGSSSDAYKHLKSHLEHKNYEEFWVLLLNRRNQVIKPYKISEGGISGTVADPKRIFKYALAHYSSGLILCHNHPSGNLKPSSADLKITQKIKSAAQHLDLQVLDHLIIVRGGYYSFADNGQL